MAKKKKNESVDTNIESLSKAESFIVKNNKKIIAGVILIVLIAGGLVWYNAAQQKKDEAALKAHAAIEAADRNLINSEDHSMMLAKFDEYMSEYEGHTATIASFQAGTHAYKAQDYNKAIQYFSQYNAGDAILNARAKACIGICYLNLGDYENALQSFEAAVAINDGIWTPEYAFYAGLTAEMLENKEKALENYNFIKNQYPDSYRGTEIDKYIGRAEAK